MGIKGISLGETKDFVSSLDKDEPKTIWKLGALDSEIFDLFGGIQNRLNAMAECVRFGLKGFENFKDGNGNEVKFSTISRAVGAQGYKVVSDNIMKILPPEVKYELANEIIKLSQLSDEEAKN